MSKFWTLLDSNVEDRGPLNVRDDTSARLVSGGALVRTQTYSKTSDGKILISESLVFVPGAVSLRALTEHDYPQEES